jgi:hypothetical protein
MFVALGELGCRCTEPLAVALTPRHFLFLDLILENVLPTRKLYDLTTSHLDINSAGLSNATCWLPCLR